jgi:taurine transport system permease protein
MFEYRGLLVGTLFVVLIGIMIWAVLFGQKIIRSEKADVLFGDPAKSHGGWHWTLMGVSSVLVVWLYFSWDAARAYFPNAANELCQVAKVEYAVNPIRSLLPLDSPYLRSTVLLQREVAQLDQLKNTSANIGLSNAQLAETQEVISLIESALSSLADPDRQDSTINYKVLNLTSRIDALTINLEDPEFPGEASEVQMSLANSQRRWGDSGQEVPVHPTTQRGYKFDAVSKEMRSIAKDFAKIRNKNPEFLALVKTINSRIKSLHESLAITSGDKGLAAQRNKFTKALNKIVKRIDDGLIFPPNTLDEVQTSLAAFEKEKMRQEGSLWYIDNFAMPGGKILAGTSTCSEQGSGRWLPKPSDTLRTMARISDPDIGYKGFPLLWYKWKPVSEMIAFLVPDIIADLIPGDYPRHNENGQVPSNFKSKVYNFVTGNYNSFSLPVPAGHIWDSLLRVLAGLFFGIVLGVPLGLFMGLSRFAKGFFDPLIELYRPVPPLAWAPLILTLFGIQDDGKIFLLFMVAFAIMVISARTGATGTKLSKIHAAHSLGASHRQILQNVILPNSLPEILTGIRIAIGVCWGTLVAAEMLAGTTGIGFVENVARKQSDYEIIWVTIIILGMLGLFFDIIMRWVITKSIPWRGKG